MIWPGDISSTCRHFCSKKDDSLWAPVCVIHYPQNGIGCMEQKPAGGWLKQAWGSIPQTARNPGEAGQDCNSCSRDQAVSLFLHGAFIHRLLNEPYLGALIQVPGRKKGNAKGKKLSQIHREKLYRKPHPTSISNLLVRTTFHGHLLLEGNLGYWHF